MPVYNPPPSIDTIPGLPEAVEKLDSIATGAEVNVNADWNASSGDAQILNKPTLGDAAAKNTGTGAGDVAAGNHTHSGLAPTGGTTGQVLKKNSNTNFDYAWAEDETGGGGVTDGDKGDITVSNSGAAWAVDSGAITYAKMQNVSATDKVLGRSTAGAGVVEEIVCTAAGRAILDDANAAAQRTTLGAAPLADPPFTGRVGVNAPSVPAAGVSSVTFGAGNTPGTIADAATIFAAPFGGVDVQLAVRNSAGQLVIFSMPTFLFEARLANDVSTAANVTPVDVPGFVFNYEANRTYVIEIFGRISAPAATTGIGLQFNTSNAIADISFQFYHQLANTGTLSGGNSIADDASQGVSSGIPANAGIYPVYGSGVLTTQIFAGTAQLRLRSETTAVATLKAGTVMRVRRVGAGTDGL